MNAFQLILLQTGIKTLLTLYLSVGVIVGCPLATELPVVALGTVAVEGAQRVDALATVAAAALLALVHILITSAAAAPAKRERKTKINWYSRL